ncbi:MAG: hypothetical protein ACR2ND_04120 [Solirubrobacteraceae bacterium]
MDPGLDDATYQKVSTLVSAEGWFFNGGGGDLDGDWYRYIRAEILQLRGVADIADYLDAVASYRFGPPEIEAPPSPEPEVALIRRPREWLAKREVSVLDLLLITIVGTIVAGIVVWIVTG